MRFDLTINEFAKKVYFNEKFEIYHADTWRPYLNLIDLSLIVGKIIQSKNLTKNKYILIQDIVRKTLQKDKSYRLFLSYFQKIKIINL